VIDVIRVESGLLEVNDRVSYWKGSAGTDRWAEVRELCGIYWDCYLGYSPISSEALERYEVKWQESAAAVKTMLAERR